MRIVAQNERRLEWVSWPWAMVAVLGGLTIIPLIFGVIGLVEGGGAALVPIGVSLLAIILFAVFVGKRRVIFDAKAGEVSVEFRSLLRQTVDTRDLKQAAEVLLYKESDESQPELVDPKSRPRLNRVRYRAALGFRDGSELNLNGTATKGSESHRIAQTVLTWLGDRKDASPSV